MATDKLLAEWFWTDRWMGSSAFGLPMEARGLYREMLTQAWRRECRIPNDHEAIQRFTGCTRAEWKRCWPKVERYWRVDGDSLVNDTQLEVYERAVSGAAKASERAAAAAHARWGRKDSPSNAPGNAQALLVQCPPSLSLSTHTPRARGASLISPGAHRSHAMCGVVCFPSSAYESCAKKLGGDEEKLRAWAAGVLDTWQRKVDAGEAIPDGDDFAFWRHRWAESFGSTKAARVEPGTLPAGMCRNRHTPPCADDIECSARRRREMDVAS